MTRRESEQRSKVVEFPSIRDEMVRLEVVEIDDTCDEMVRLRSPCFSCFLADLPSQEGGGEGMLGVGAKADICWAVLYSRSLE